MNVKVTVYAYTEEMERLRSFYSAALGVTPEDQGDWQPFELAGGSFALHGVPSGAGRDLQRFSVSFEVDDIDAAIARCVSAGATIIEGIVDQEFGRIATLEDPDGRRFDVIQHG